MSNAITVSEKLEGSGQRGACGFGVEGVPFWPAVREHRACMV